MGSEEPAHADERFRKFGTIWCWRCWLLCERVTALFKILNLKWCSAFLFFHCMHLPWAYQHTILERWPIQIPILPFYFIGLVILYDLVERKRPMNWKKQKIFPPRFDGRLQHQLSFLAQYFELAAQEFVPIQHSSCTKSIQTIWNNGGVHPTGDAMQAISNAMYCSALKLHTYRSTMSLPWGHQTNIKRY